MLRGAPATASSRWANLAGKRAEGARDGKPEPICIFQGRLGLKVGKN